MSVGYRDLPEGSNTNNEKSFPDNEKIEEEREVLYVVYIILCMYVIIDWDYFKKIRMTEGFTKLLWGRLEFRRNERIITKLFWRLLEL